MALTVDVVNVVNDVNVIVAVVAVDVLDVVTVVVNDVVSSCCSDDNIIIKSQQCIKLIYKNYTKRENATNINITFYMVVTFEQT